MKPRHWMQIAAVASAVGLAGSAIANDDVAGASAGATSEGAARVIDQATPQPAYGARIDSALQSSDVNPNASSSAPGDVDTNAAAASSLDGNASTANDLNHQNAVNANDRAQDNAANASEADRNGAANANEGSVSGTTQGSTM